MGNIPSRLQRQFLGLGNEQEQDEAEANGFQAKFSQRSGSYFGSHFLMGGERFESVQPEMFMFGDNTDLDFLATKPVPFPYSKYSCTDPTRTLSALVNIRRDSVKLIKIRRDTNNVRRRSARTNTSNNNVCSTIVAVGAGEGRADERKSDEDRQKNEEVHGRNDEHRHNNDEHCHKNAEDRDKTGEDRYKDDQLRQKNDEARHEVDELRQHQESLTSVESGASSSTTTGTSSAENSSSTAAESGTFARPAADGEVLTPDRENNNVIDEPRNNNLEQLPSTITADRYRLEFVFDCDVPCSVQIHFFAKEALGADGSVQYLPRRPEQSSRRYLFEIGANQSFSEFIIDPSDFDVDKMSYDPAEDVYPVVIHCEALDGDRDEPAQSHATLATIDGSAEGRGCYVLKPLKQKLFVDGVCYLLQELYGIENKNTEYRQRDPSNSAKGSQESLLACGDENGSECVVCMSDIRDTVILPCRHLCMCNACAETLRYKASNCPICRSPFRALLQLKAMRLLSGSAPALVEADGTHRQVSRYETLPLIEALNGPIDHTQTCVTTVPSATRPTVTKPANVHGFANLHPVQQTTLLRAGNNNMPSSRSESDIVHNARPPRHGGRKKKTPRPVAPIQEVLTVSRQPPHEKPVDENTVEFELDEHVERRPSRPVEPAKRTNRPISLVVNEVDECPELLDDDDPSPSLTQTSSDQPGPSRRFSTTITVENNEGCDSD